MTTRVLSVVSTISLNGTITRPVRAHDGLTATVDLIDKTGSKVFGRLTSVVGDG
jgi:hypothetical protein